MDGGKGAGAHVGLEGKYKNERDLMKGRNDSEASNEQANEEVKLPLAPSDLDAVIVDQQETVKN